MNPVIIVHAISALVLIGAALPLWAGKVPMNSWYGVRIPEAFESEKLWYAINRHGGRLLFVGGLCLALTAVMGAGVPRRYWVAYNVAVTVEVLLGLVMILVLISRHARRLKEEGDKR